MSSIRFGLFVSILWTQFAAAVDPPFSDRADWMQTFDDAETVGPILILFYSTPNRETERLERDFSRWEGIPELLDRYVKVSLKVEDHRELASACRVLSVPSLVLIRRSDSGDLSNRVMGVLENISNREAVLGFLQTGLMMTSIDPGEILAQEAEVKSVSDVLKDAAMALKERNYPQAFEGYEKAVRMLPSGTSERHLEIHLKLADLYYKAGRFAEAIDHYRKAVDSLPKENDRKNSLHIFSRLALLLNDQGENEEAIRFLEDLEKLVGDPKRLEELAEEKKAFAAGLYVLAGRGYPGVGLDPPEGMGAGEVEGATAEAPLSLEEKLDQVKLDLDGIESLLSESFKRDGVFPDFLDEIPELQPGEEKIPRDPFSRGFPYLYLHLEDPEDYFLYSVGPDGTDQFGEVRYGPEQGPDGGGDIVRRFTD